MAQVRFWLLDFWSCAHVVIGPIIVRHVTAAKIVECVMGTGMAVPTGRSVLRSLSGPRTLPGLVTGRVRAATARITDV